MGVGQQLADELAEHALVPRVCVGVQQRDRNGFGPRGGDLAHELSCGVGVELAQEAVGRHALARAKAQLGGHERGRLRVAQAVQVRTRLAAELDHVGEAVGGDQRGARRRALQQRVGRDGHAVREAAHVLGLGAGAREHERDGLQHAFGLATGRRGDLGGVNG